MCVQHARGRKRGGGRRDRGRREEGGRLSTLTECKYKAFSFIGHLSSLGAVMLSRCVPHVRFLQEFDTCWPVFFLVHLTHTHRSLTVMVCGILCRRKQRLDRTGADNQACIRSTTNTSVPKRKCHQAQDDSCTR